MTLPWFPLSSRLFLGGVCLAIVSAGSARTHVVALPPPARTERACTVSPAGSSRNRQSRWIRGIFGPFASSGIIGAGVDGHPPQIVLPEYDWNDVR